MSDFEESKAKAEGKCTAADTTAEKSPANKKFGAYEDAAKAYVELADLWKTYNLVQYEINMQKAADRHRKAAASTANAVDKKLASAAAGQEEMSAADALMKLGEAAEAAKDPAQADAYYKKAKEKFLKAKGDYTDAGDAAKAASADGAATKAQQASDKVQKFIK
ncbi:MAG TPA: hypothetical protein VMG55_03885 [Stellaceae bacterium]|nr:hypothetical protein [Stellaceae bacterium]